ncbi:hypothetical protein K1T71_004595 [Dendrolimus kikuchii]|uniref:Uncharacterized protein n=1 Tax=Dendrolimus kikuchii TaxID=765133 RepID=A0ACC1D7R7_9NEOP|nr:hypothetical protein K1T71_004595 [Dendrolimus kikuchii]
MCRIHFIIISFVILITHCNLASTNIFDDAYSRFIERYTSLSLQSVYILIQKQPKETILTSIFPGLCDLATLTLHSNKKTKQDLLQFLQLNNSREVKHAVKKLRSKLDYEFMVKMYASHDRCFREKFVQDYKKNCGGEVGYIDYGNVDYACQVINQWANNQTYKPGVDMPMITPDELCCKSGIIAVSAHEFVVEWDNEPSFKVMDFQIDECKTIKIPTLYGNRLLRYADIENLNCQFIDITLNKICFVRLIAPNTVDGLPEVMRKLQCHETYNEAEKQMKELRAMIYAPLGEVFKQSNLKEILQKELYNISIFNHQDSGLENVYEDNDNAYICNMIHRTNLLGSRRLLNKTEGSPDSDDSTTNISNTKPECTVPEVKVKYPFVYIIFCKGVLKLIGAYYVFGDVSNPFNAFFIRDVRNILNGQLRNVNYRTPVRTAAGINAWIKRTVPRNGNVNSTTPITPHFISQLRSNSLLFTAAYNFSWNWEYPFNPKYTKLYDYDTGLGYKIKLPLIYRIGYYKYANLTDLEAQAIEIPYKGRNYGILIVVPYQANHIDKLSTKLKDPAVFKNINARMRYQHLQIYYPKGKLAENINLLRNIEEITSCSLLLNDIKGALASGCNANVAGIYASVYTSDDEGHGNIDYEMNPNIDVPKVKMNKPLIYYVMHIKDGKNDPILSGVSMNIMNVPVE